MSPLAMGEMEELVGVEMVGVEEMEEEEMEEEMEKTMMIVLVVCVCKSGVVPSRYN